jgi:bifunctional UDP-N-acetylglucosamine pyrophosphorylase/glucosamine-1-phosphate N-acetyltransferase
VSHVRAVTVVVIAAGEGTRMKSPNTPKVMHGFAGRTLLGHLLAATEPLKAQQTVVVVGHLRDQLTAHLKEIAPEAGVAIQHEQHGTGHAVRVALDSLAPADGTVLVLPGDVPLIESSTLAALLEAHEAGTVATLLTSTLPDPTGYGRVLRDATGTVIGVVEEKDATETQRAIHEVATGIYAFDDAFLRAAVTQLTTDNVQGEQYLPDVIAIATNGGRTVRALIAPADQTAGVNDRVQLAHAHRVYNDRLLTAHMQAGVTVIDPATTWVDASVRLEPDATILPGVQLYGETEIASGAVIGPDTTLTDTSVGPRSQVQRAVAYSSTIGADVTIGPFAYLRPGTVLHDEVHIGTYVELKKSEVGRGTKIPHLSYIGDATIGEQTNIGAATVFVNYDGEHKHRTVVGDHARTGADNMFVAPVEIGDGAYTAAGSIITEDVPPGAMGIARARQTNVADWVARNRPGSAADNAAQQAAQNTAASPPTSETDPGGTQQ